MSKPEWQPIETAPKDGSMFLTYSPGSSYNMGLDFAEYDELMGEFCKHGCYWEGVTHWMPMPDPPQ